MSEDEWDWVTEQVDGADHKHLLIGSSLPCFLPYGMHDIEAWSEAVTDGAWGERFDGLGEKVRITANLDHWACFQKSYRELEDLVVDIATGRCGEPPDSLVFLGGDVHHCWLSEISLPPEAGTSRTRIWQAVCSGVRKELQASERIVLTFGHTRAAELLGRALARSVRIARPRLRWQEVKPSRPSATRSAPWRSPTARRRSSSSRSPAAGATRASCPVLEHRLY